MAMAKEIKETVHYIGDIRYVSSITSDSYRSKQDVVKEHIKYIDRSAVFVYGDKDLVIRNAEKYDKRVNSRVAGKTVFALPNDITREDYEKWCNYIRKVLSENFDVNPNYIYIAIHEEHDLQSELQTKNLHAHVVFNPIDTNGKAIQTKISDLKSLHKSWQKILENNGYKIKRYDEQLGKLGWKLRKDKDLLEAYKNYLDSKRKQEQLEQQASQEKQKQSSNLRSILSLVQEVETVIVEVEVEVKEEQKKATDKERAILEPKPQPEPPRQAKPEVKPAEPPKPEQKKTIEPKRPSPTYSQFKEPPKPEKELKKIEPKKIDTKPSEPKPQPELPRQEKIEPKIEPKPAEPPRPPEPNQPKPDKNIEPKRTEPEPKPQPEKKIRLINVFKKWFDNEKLNKDIEQPREPKPSEPKPERKEERKEIRKLTNKNEIEILKNMILIKKNLSVLPDAIEFFECGYYGVKDVLGNYHLKNLQGDKLIIRGASDDITYSYFEGQNKNIIVVVSDIDDYISSYNVKYDEFTYAILNSVDSVNDFIESMETLSSVKKELNLILMLNDKNITQKIIDRLMFVKNIGIKVGVYSANSLYDAIVNDERIVLKTIKEPKPDEPEPPEPPDEPRGPRGPGL